MANHAEAVGVVIPKSNSPLATTAGLPKAPKPKRGVNTPILLRFPQLLFGQIRKLQTAFKKSIREFEYQGGHLCVYPMKVNQNRAVIEEYLREGSRYDFGLEAGSKAELYAALGLDQAKDSLLVLNGFKDRDFVKLAFAGAGAGKNVVIVIEKLSELDHTLAIANEVSAENPEAKLPMIGVRVKQLHGGGIRVGERIDVILVANDHAGVRRSRRRPSAERTSALTVMAALREDPGSTTRAPRSSRA